MDNMVTEKVDVLQEFFGPNVERLAHELKVIQRVRKFTGVSLLLTIVFSFLEDGKASYRSMASFSHILGIGVKRQSIFERFNEPLVKFLKQIFEESLVKLSKTWTIPLSIFKPFTAVYLLDSTHLTLRKELKDEYTRSGNNNQAGIKLQTNWDYLKGNLAWLDCKEGKEADQGYDYTKKLEKGTLILFDLAYVGKKKLKALMERGAYFLCRYDRSSNLYDALGEKIDLEKYLKKDLVEMEVSLEKKKKPIRLIAKRMPKEVSEKRLANITAKAKDRGKPVSAQAVKYIEWQIYITNVPKIWLMAELVCSMYCLRWQIELLFKLWKSEGNLNHQPGKTTWRVLGETYAKLMGLTLFCYLTEPVYVTKEGVPLEEAEFNQLLELSAPKAIKVFHLHVVELAKILNEKKRGKLISLLKSMEEEWLNYGVKERQRKRKSTFEKLQNEGVRMDTFGDAVQA